MTGGVNAASDSYTGEEKKKKTPKTSEKHTSMFWLMFSD